MTRKRPGVTSDQYGNDIADWSTPSALAISGCSVQPAGGSDFFERREAITTVWTVWAPLDANILDTDRIEYAGTDYEIDGPVQRWEVGSQLDHLVLQLKKVSG